MFNLKQVVGIPLLAYVLFDYTVSKHTFSYFAYSVLFALIRTYHDCCEAVTRNRGSPRHTLVHLHNLKLTTLDNATELYFVVVMFNIMVKAF